MDTKDSIRETSQDLPIAKVASFKERVSVLGIGLLVNTIFNTYLFDYLLYPFVIWKMGIIKGGIIMTLLAGIFCYLLIVLYDWSKKDWLGIETVKELQNYDGNSKIGRVTSYILKRSDPVVMLFLSIEVS